MTINSWNCLQSSKSTKGISHALNQLLFYITTCILQNAYKLDKTVIT